MQITLAQNPPVHEISQQDARTLQNAFVKLFSDGSAINGKFLLKFLKLNLLIANNLDFAMRLEERNGLDDQTINNIAKVVVKEVSGYITSVATTSPNSQNFVSAIVSVIQEFDILQDLLNKEGKLKVFWVRSSRFLILTFFPGYNDEGIFAYVLVGVYNDVLLTLKTMAEPFVQSIRFLDGNDVSS